MQKNDKKTKRISRLSEKELLVSILSHQREIERRFGLLSHKIAGISMQLRILTTYNHEQRVKERQQRGEVK